MAHHPLFITCEGGEGSGKSTLIHRLAEALKERGFDVVQTREPGGVPLAEDLRKILLEHKAQAPIGSMTELMLFLAARAQHVEELIKPALNQGKVVLCDRFNDSTIAYQGFARGLGIEAVQKLCTFVCNGTEPDITFFLDVDPAEGLKRTTRLHKDHAPAGQMDRMESEKLEFHEKVRTGMRRLVKMYPERIRMLDAHLSQDAVYEQALQFLEPLLYDDQVDIPV